MKPGCRRVKSRRLPYHRSKGTAPVELNEQLREKAIYLAASPRRRREGQLAEDNANTIQNGEMHARARHCRSVHEPPTITCSIPFSWMNWQKAPEIYSPPPLRIDLTFCAIWFSVRATKVLNPCMASAFVRRRVREILWL